MNTPQYLHAIDRDLRHAQARTETSRRTLARLDLHPDRRAVLTKNINREVALFHLDSAAASLACALGFIRSLNTKP